MVTDDWPQIAKLEWLTKRIRKLPGKIKVILLGCVSLSISLITDDSGIQNDLNHTFEYLAAFIEMEALYSLQFINLSIITCLKYNISQK